jgi:Domain of unknown function (DUF4440)
MKTSLLVFVFFLFAFIHSGKCLPPANNDSIKLLQYEDLMAKCYMKYDAKTIEKLVAKGFIYSENDQTYTREQVVQQLSAGSDKIESAMNENMQVHLYGTTALITGWLIIKEKNADGPFERRYRFTDVWMKVKGDWQIIGAHDFIN